MLQRLASLAVAAVQQQHSHLLLPLLQQFQQQHALVQPQQPHHHHMQPAQQPLWAPFPQLQLAHGYAQRAGKLNPKERKAQTVKDKKALKKSAGGAGGAQSGASAAAADGATSFEDEMQAVEADVTRLVLQAIHNITPVLDVRTVRSATTVKYVPGLMPPRKARSLALHWLVKAADVRKKNSSASYAECLALELLLAYQKRGGARQKRDDLHKLALQNRANVHMRWW